MKICIVSPSIDGVGGQERVTSLIANSLANHHGFDVSLAFTTGKFGSQDFAYKVNSKIHILWDRRLNKQKGKYILPKIYRVLYKNKIIVHKSRKSLNRIISKKETEQFEQFFFDNEFDLVIAVGPHMSGVLGLANIPAKKIGWLHSSYERYFETYKDYLWNQGEIYTQAYNGLDKLLVLTQSAKNKFSQQTHAPVVVMSNPLTVKKSPYTFNGGRTLLYVGRLVTEVKGLDKLLTSISYLKNENQKLFKLLIVGEGPDRQALNDLVKEKNLDEVVTFVGSTSYVEEYYKSSDILLVPSRAEGFGLVVIEGMAYGLPVVSYETEGPSQIIKNEKTGFLVKDFDENEFFEKTDILLNNIQIRRKMSENAYNESEKYSLSSVINNWIKLISEV